MCFIMASNDNPDPLLQLYFPVSPEWKVANRLDEEDLKEQELEHEPVCFACERTQKLFPHFRFYRLPTKPKVLQEWRVRYRDVGIIIPEIMDNLYICEIHFLNSAFDGRELKPNAIPAFTKLLMPIEPMQQ